ncbi:MAG: sulfurtransferase, partial [Dehalococcoidia bacterium]|nr:sulfurtransferase [Dehalococcoidia bacterium]
MTTGEGFAHPEFLVDAAWVEAHKDDSNLVVVDCEVEPA